MPNVNRDYFDSLGYLTDVLPHGVNENRPQWTAIYKILQDILGEMFAFNDEALYDDNGKLHCYPLDFTKLKEQKFSRDNMISLLGYYKQNGLEAIAKMALKDNFGIQYILQPQDLIYFSYCKDGLGKHLLPFLKWNMKYSCLKMSQHAGGELDTDGLLLAFIRCWGGRNPDFQDVWDKINSKLGEKLTDYINSGKASAREIALAQDGAFNPMACPWSFIFAQYFAAGMDHPIVQTAVYLDM